jgi:phosphohistidine phosphatase
MHIYLLRHGIAEDGHAGLADADRGLTEEGWKRLRKAGGAWRRVVDDLDLMMVSPLRRAQQTATTLVEAVRFTGEARMSESLVPGAPPTLALAELEAEALSGTRGVALVGHEPHLGYLLGALLTGHPRQPIPFKKGMLVGVETEGSASLVGQLRFALSSKAAAELS